MHTHSEDGGDVINIITGVSVGCVVVVMVIMLLMVTVVRSKKSHCHDQANSSTTDAGVLQSVIAFEFHNKLRLFFIQIHKQIITLRMRW